MVGSERVLFTCDYIDYMCMALGLGSWLENHAFERRMDGLLGQHEEDECISRDRDK